jgi:hypothetical protein
MAFLKIALLPFLFYIFFAMTPPSITLKTNGDTLQLPSAHFFHTGFGVKATQQTIVKLHATATHLIVHFECLQNPFTNQNTYTQNNTELYNQEVFELFICKKSDYPTKYYELEINPNNALFLAEIANKTGNEVSGLTLLDPVSFGIVSNVQKGDDHWKGSFSLPWAVLGERGADYKLNFFRIIAKKSSLEPNWTKSNEICDFLAWSPSHSGHEPLFHKTAAFGNLTIQP